MASLIQDNRVNHVCPADYSEGSKMEFAGYFGSFDNLFQPRRVDIVEDANAAPPSP